MFHFSRAYISMHCGGLFEDFTELFIVNAAKCKKTTHRVDSKARSTVVTVPQSPPKPNFQTGETLYRHIKRRTSCQVTNPNHT